LYIREALLPEKDRPDKENQLTLVRTSGEKFHSVSCGSWPIQHPLVRGVGIFS
jgi:hypothetical protein